MQTTNVKHEVSNRAVTFLLHLTTKKPNNRMCRLATEVNRRIAYNMADKFRDGVEVNYEIRLRWFSNFILGFVSDDSIVVDVLVALGEMAIMRMITRS